ncbi:hypothetical protein [Aquimarina macrocephali]|uniref:hypothetical protein n=1 Tax=Aquimarina macrocephali TaxID=666563 RepID=UPI003F667447
MSVSNNVIEIKEEFIKKKINRAYCGLSSIKVVNDGIYYAHLKNKIYSYSGIGGDYSGKRSLRASIVIFTGLIDRYKNFECDDIRYYFNDHKGVWMWQEVG